MSFSVWKIVIMVYYCWVKQKINKLIILGIKISVVLNCLWDSVGKLAANAVISNLKNYIDDFCQGMSYFSFIRVINRLLVWNMSRVKIIFLLKIGKSVGYYFSKVKCKPFDEELIGENHVAWIYFSKIPISDYCKQVFISFYLTHYFWSESVVQWITHLQGRATNYRSQFEIEIIFLGYLGYY